LYNGEVYDWFRYHVVRVWQQPVDLLLASGLTVLPLAPVSDVKIEGWTAPNLRQAGVCPRDVMPVESPKFDASILSQGAYR
jgi:hypothetical protein